MKILFLGETYRADAQTWIMGIEVASGYTIDTKEIRTFRFKPIRAVQGLFFIVQLIWGRFFGPKYDLVLAERSTSYGFFSLFTNAKVKVVAQQGISDIYPNTFVSVFYKKIIQRFVYKNVDLIHAWGNSMAHAMVMSGADPIKIVVRPKGVDLKKYIFTNQFNSNKAFELRAVVTRSLANDYNHHIIIEAVSQLKTHGVILRVDIIGDGPLKEQLIQLTKELNVADIVTFLGRIPNDDLPLYLSKCPIYISTPITEGASSSLMEAMAVGCFPIVTDLPGNKSFIQNGVNGLLIQVGSVKSLVDAIVCLKDGHYNPSSSVQMNRRTAVEKFDRAKNMEYFYSYYSKILRSD
jgi:glycosyltransferase involved in cell wall biosynthesis